MDVTQSVEMTMLHCSDACAWAHENFAGASLGDKRRNQRLIAMAGAFVLHPGATIPNLFKAAYDIQATYDFFSRPEVTPDAIQMPHRRKVHEAMCASDSPVLVIQDTSSISYSGKSKIDGLGPVGKGRDFEQGYFVHSAIAVKVVGDSDPGVRPPVEILGLIDQQYYVRKASGARGESKKSRHGLNRESQRWAKAVERIGPAPQGAQWIEISDRESDIFEYLQTCLDASHGFVVRANQDRGVIGEEHPRLFETAHDAPVIGTYDLALRARPGKAARTAKVQVAATTVQLRAPYRPDTVLQPITCSVIRVSEIDPPNKEDQVHWVLLSDAEIESFYDAIRVIGYYSTRWIIEEFHKALKSGMGAERLQLTHADRLKPTVALMSVIALSLIDLREHVRLKPEDPAEHAKVGELELNIFD